MREILPGVFHWTVDWPGYFPLESYWLFPDGGSVIVDPVDSAGLMPLEGAAPVLAVVVTSRWHERSARLLAIRTGAPLYVPAAEVENFEDIDECETYVAGDILPGDLLAISTAGGEWSAGEHALLSPLHGGTLLVADAWAQPPSGPPGTWRSAVIRTSTRTRQRACPTCLTTNSQTCCPATASRSWAGRAKPSGNLSTRV